MVIIALRYVPVVQFVACLTTRAKTMSDKKRKETKASSLFGYWRGVRGILIILAMLSSVALGLFFDLYTAKMSQPLWDALEALNETLFYQNLWQLSVFVVFNIANSICLDWLVWMCRIQWRSFVSWPLIKAIYKEGDVLGMQSFFESVKERFGYLQGAVKKNSMGQVIQEDVSKAMMALVYITKNLLRLGKLALYSIVLYRISPAWVFASGLIIPHYLVWLAWAVGAVAGGFCVWVARALGSSYSRQADAENGFRQVMVAIEGQINYILSTTGLAAWYEKRLEHHFERALDVMRSIRFTSLMLDMFQHIIKKAIWLFPFLLVSPLIFNGSLTTGAFFQVSFIFQRVFTAIQDMFKDIREYYQTYTSTSRVHILHQGLKEASAVYKQERAKCLTKDHGMYMAVQVHIDPKAGEPYNVGFEIKKGEKERLLGKMLYLKAKSGFGKSQLLRVIAGSRVGLKRVMPEDMDCFYLPQKPVNLNAGLSVTDYLRINAKGEQDVNIKIQSALANLIELELLDEKGLAKMNLTSSDSEEKLIAGIGAMLLSNLSGGQRQKVDLVRALLHSNAKTLLVADEPFASMDDTSIKKAKTLVQECLDEKSMGGVLLVDHSYKSKVGKLDAFSESCADELHEDERNLLENIKTRLSSHTPTDVIDVERLDAQKEAIKQTPSALKAS